MQAATKVSQSTATGASGVPVVVLAISGDISSVSKATLMDAYHAIEPSVRKLLLDFRSVDYINSSGIATIIQLLLEASKSDRTVGIFGLSPHFTKVFTMVGVAKYAELSPDLSSALQKL